MNTRVLVVCLSLSFAAFAERLNLEQLGKIVRVSNPQISPDGRSVVVLVSRANYKENRRDSELVQVDVATRAQKVLTRRQASQAKWSPDGTRLAFLVPVEGKAQIFVLPIDGGEAVQVSRAATAVQSYAWRPDGKAFAYNAQEESAQARRRGKAQPVVRSRRELPADRSTSLQSPLDGPAGGRRR